MKYQRGDCGVTLVIAMVVLMVGYFTLRGHDGAGMHRVAGNVQTDGANPPSAVLTPATAVPGLVNRMMVHE